MAMRCHSLVGMFVRVMVHRCVMIFYTWTGAVLAARPAAGREACSPARSDPELAAEAEEGAICWESFGDRELVYSVQSPKLIQSISS